MLSSGSGKEEGGTFAQAHQERKRERERNESDVDAVRPRFLLTDLFVWLACMHVQVILAALLHSSEAIFF